MREHEQKRSGGGRKTGGRPNQEGSRSIGGKKGARLDVICSGGGETEGKGGACRSSARGRRSARSRERTSALLGSAVSAAAKKY